MKAKSILCILLLAICAIPNANAAIEMPDIQMPSLPKYEPLSSDELLQNLREDMKKSSLHLNNIPPAMQNPMLSKSLNNMRSTPRDKGKIDWAAIIGTIIICVWLGMGYYLYRRYRRRCEEERIHRMQEASKKYQEDCNRRYAEELKRKAEARRWYADENGNISSNLNNFANK